MIARHLLAALALVAAVPSAIAAPVEVTRFHTPDSLVTLGRGAIAVVGAPGTDAASLETRVWLRAVEAELAALHFGSATPGAADAYAEVRVEREVVRPERKRGPVSVGGGPLVVVQTRLAVTIRSRTTGQSLWEGRTDNTEKESAKSASVDQAAPRLAHALFSGFPGASGATITVK